MVKNVNRFTGQIEAYDVSLILKENQLILGGYKVVITIPDQIATGSLSSLYCRARQNIDEDPICSETGPNEITAIIND